MMKAKSFVVGLHTPTVDGPSEVTTITLTAGPFEVKFVSTIGVITCEGWYRARRLFFVTDGQPMGFGGRWPLRFKRWYRAFFGHHIVERAFERLERKAFPDRYQEYYECHVDEDGDDERLLLQGNSPLTVLLHRKDR